MIKKVIVALVSIALVSGVFSPVVAQSPEASPAATINESAVPEDEYSRALVVSVSEISPEGSEFLGPVQSVKLRLVSGSEAGKEMDLNHGDLFAISEEQKVAAGDTVVIVRTQGPTGSVYYITDKYRAPALGIIFAVFLALAVFFGRIKGLRSIFGLLLSIGILIQFVIPKVLEGNDPLLVSFIGALVIAFLSLYLAHGISKTTSVALASTIITLVIAAVLSIVFVKFASLTGTGSEEAVFLRMGPVGAIDLKGLLLGGIIIGALGVLDDITVAQSATVAELKKVNAKLTRNELYRRGISLGQEHIASLINTLALAYTGASLPLLLLFSLGGNIPFWLTFNSEFIAEEVIRTLVGSTALILAVPISTFLATWVVSMNDIQVASVATTKPRGAKKASVRKTRKAS